METDERIFSIADLRELLGLKKDYKITIEILKNLTWLKELQLIDYKITKAKSNLGTTANVFELIDVNYYTNGGMIGQMLESSIEVLTDEIKERIVNEQLVVFEEEE